MALRVLLADESSTIKKVMQLALQDYAVEVKAVPVGIDVLPVTKSFKPDIIFADVLLTKRNGYEVCSDLKSDLETQNIPVVLMWSGFMEIDEQKVSACRADGRLEKPFDAETLRSLVQKFVPKTVSNPISTYLKFPEMPEFQEAPPANADMGEISLEEVAMPSYSEPASPHFAAEETYTPVMESQNVSFGAAESISVDAIPEAEEDEGWTRQDLTKFKIQIPDEQEDFTKKFVIPQDDLSHVELQPEAPGSQYEEVHFEAPRSQASLAAGPTPTMNESVKSMSHLDMAPEMMEKILRQEAREIIESICWKILPDIAERVVREEINKILRDSEKSL